MAVSILATSAAAAKPAPQLTARAIVLAIVLAVLMGAANTYLGLFAGMTIASAIPSAVVSMAVLKVLGHGGILENNIVQTGGSAGSSTATGIIFTVPALVMLGAWNDYRYGWVFAFAALGGVLGVLFSVPLRRALIVDQKLAFPEGTAAAEVLRAGADPTRGAKLLSMAAAALCRKTNMLLKRTITVASSIGCASRPKAFSWTKRREATSGGP